MGLRASRSSPSSRRPKPPTVNQPFTSSQPSQSSLHSPPQTILPAHSTLGNQNELNSPPANSPAGQQSSTPSIARAPPSTSPSASKKRKNMSSSAPAPSQDPGPSPLAFGDPGGPSQASEGAAESASAPPAKKTRTNTPWTPAEEKRLKELRDAGTSWSEIAKVVALHPRRLPLLVFADSHTRPSRTGPRGVLRSTGIRYYLCSMVLLGHSLCSTGHALRGVRGRRGNSR